jgi:hypothetical protein
MNGGDPLDFFRDSFQNQVILCTALMVLVPLTTFLYLRTYLADLWISKDT